MDQASNLRYLLDRQTPQKPSKPPARVITITSGKGGVGKSNITVNLAHFLGRHEKKVVVLDADFGLANIEILLGASPKKTLNDVLNGSVAIGDTITKINENVSFISGGSGLVDLADYNRYHLDHVLDNMHVLDEIADIILIDTGAGISEAVMRFVLASGETMIICAPEPTSITDAYSLIKMVKERGQALPRFRIVINRTESKDEGHDIFRNLQRVAGRFLAVELEHLGSIPHDSNLIKAVKLQMPCITTFPHSGFSKEIENIGNKILDITPVKEPTGMKGFVRKLARLWGG